MLGLQSVCEAISFKRIFPRKGGGVVSAVIVWPFLGLHCCDLRITLQGKPGRRCSQTKQLCEICLRVGQHSPWPLTLCCSPDASFRDAHGHRAAASSLVGGAGGGVEWSLCTSRWLREVQRKLEVERWQDPWVTPPSFTASDFLYLFFLVFPFPLLQECPTAFLFWLFFYCSFHCWDLWHTSWEALSTVCHFDCSGCCLSLSSFLCDRHLDMRVK